MGGKRKSTTTQTYQPPSWVEGGAQQAVGIGQRIGAQEYRPYEGERVAGPSENERRGMELARSSTGAALPYYEQAQTLAERGSQQFADTDIDQYMNPYIKGALDPVAREIREEGARGEQALAARSASIGAFGGSRGALLEAENREKTLQGISDVYGKGYASAYESAVNIWGGERTRDLQAAGRIQDLGTSVQQAHKTDVSTLMATGATDRNIQQAMKDFDYQQFIEDRDWDFRNLGGLLSALQGTQGSYSTTATGVTEESGGELAQMLGVAATVLGVFFPPAAAIDDVVEAVA